MLEVLRSNYVRTARAKGLTDRQILVRHALRGGLLPVVSFSGPALAYLVTGTVVVERIFALPGLGNYFINANLNRDEPLIIGIVAFLSILILVFNLRRGHRVRLHRSAGAVLTWRSPFLPRRRPARSSREPRSGRTHGGGFARIVLRLPGSSSSGSWCWPRWRGLPSSNGRPATRTTTSRVTRRSSVRCRHSRRLTDRSHGRTRWARTTPAATSSPACCSAAAFR